MFANYALPSEELRVNAAALPTAWRDLLVPLYDEDKTLHIQHVATGGSDRSFYRVDDGAWSCIVCVTPQRTEFEAYLKIGEFLREWGMPVPAIYAHADATGLAVLQDAGRTPLQSVVLSTSANSAETIGAYQRVLTVLGQLQSVPAWRCRPMHERPFTALDLRWETEYFREHFLHRLLGWDTHEDGALTADFATLASRVLAEPLFPMHRDFQSQNVFLQGERVWVLDFQGARVGPMHYDIASLLRDPYVCLPAAAEDQLLQYYYSRAMPASAPYISWQQFRETYSLVSLQRVMQALGAYGFLGLVKAKPWFLRWVEPALSILCRAIDEVSGLDRLRRVVHEAGERYAQAANLAS